jgi:hypothetical protein
MAELIYSGKAIALYGQIALFDCEDKESYPQFETGFEKAVLGSKGVAVTALPDSFIDISVYDGDLKGEDVFYLSGEIQVGKAGLFVGNEISAMIEKLNWPSGKTHITVYANGARNEATKVVFILKHISD